MLFLYVASAPTVNANVVAVFGFPVTRNDSCRDAGPGGDGVYAPVLPWASPGRGHTPSPIAVGAARGSERLRTHRSARFGSDRARARSRAWKDKILIPTLRDSDFDPS